MPLSNLLTDLIADLDKPILLWQVGIVLVCVVLGSLLARTVRSAYAVPGEGSHELLYSRIANFGYVLTPAVIAIVIAIAQFVAVPLLGKLHLVRIALALVGSLAIIRLAFYLLRRAFARHGPLGAALVTFEKVIALLVWVCVALYVTGLWAGVFDLLDNTVIPLGKNKIALSAILQGMISVVVLLMVALWAGAALEERLMGVAGLHSSLRVFMARMGRSILVVVAVLLSLSMVGIDLTVLSVFGGALGVGLGLGLQKIASNYVSGFIILIERSLTIGDIISVDKYSGKVTQINTRYTILQGGDGVETVLPNEMLVSGVIQNQSLSNRVVQVSTLITVAYRSDLDVVIPLLEAQPAKIERVLSQPPPAVTLKRFSTDGYELELGFWIADPENGKGSVISAVNKEIYTLIKSGQITLSYPSALSEINEM